MTYMITVTGVEFDLNCPQAEDVRIVDIAHALSHISRWNGHTPGRTPYTVAQHSVLMAQWLAEAGCVKDAQVCGLMHDAHEAYIGDISRPMKRIINSAALRRTMIRLDTVIAEAFNFTWGYSTTIEIYDDGMLEWEEWRIMKHTIPAPDRKPISPDNLFDCVWDYERANKEFMRTFVSLCERGELK